MRTLLALVLLSTAAHADNSAATVNAAASGSQKLLGSGTLIDKAKNPAVTVNALIGGAFGDALPAADRGLRVQDAEAMFAAAVDNHVYGNLVLRAPGGAGFGVEEAYITTLSLSPVTLKAGKFLVSFGKNNWRRSRGQPLIDRPLVNRRLLGGGFNSVGAEASVLLPLPWHADLTVGGVRADGSGAFSAGNPENLAGTARLEMRFPVGEGTTIDLGGSFARSRENLAGADLTLRLAAVAWTTEWIRKWDTEAASGVYSSLLWEVAPLWWVGGRFDWLDSGGTSTTAENAILAFVPSEYFVLRAQGGIVQNPGGGTTWQALAQMGITIGSHPAHPY